jgi:hypothetical protein
VSGSRVSFSENVLPQPRPGHLRDTHLILIRLQPREIVHDAREDKNLPFSRNVSGGLLDSVSIVCDPA